jgi:serine/threonine protein kinase
MGAFSKVKIGVNKSTNEEVAVKIIKKDTMNIRQLELHRNEIKILKLCQHPNIIRLIEVYENPKYFYLVMEKIDGSDILAYLKSSNKLLTEKVVV